MVDVKKLREELRTFYTKRHEANGKKHYPPTCYTPDGKPQFGFLEIPGSLRLSDNNSADVILAVAWRDDEYRDSVIPDKAVIEMIRRINDAISELVDVLAIYEAALYSSPAVSPATDTNGKLLRPNPECNCEPLASQQPDCQAILDSLNCLAEQ